MLSVVVYCVLSFALPVTCKPTRTIVCNELDENVLSDILGPAYNSRYMSIRPPVPEKEEIDADDTDAQFMDGHQKRKVNYHDTFYVDDHYIREIADAPAWSVKHVDVDDIKETAKNSSSRRLRRRVTSDMGDKTAKGPARQWECSSRIVWLDLGPNYFPRYLRSVECTRKTCWYGHYKCKPRSFTVKLLRRKEDRCTVAKAGGAVGVHGLPVDLRELWVWEERAVNFCCDCTP